jgi:hypothetical protein
MVTYHTAVVPFGPDIMASLNDRITAAFKITESASPHQMRCEFPIGLNIPDLLTRTAQQRINLALGALTPITLKGKPCDGAFERYKASPDFRGKQPPSGCQRESAALLKQSQAPCRRWGS